MGKLKYETKAIAENAPHGVCTVPRSTDHETQKRGALWTLWTLPYVIDKKREKSRGKDE